MFYDPLYVHDAQYKLPASELLIIQEIFSLL